MADLTSLLFSEIFGDKVTTTPVLEVYPNCEDVDYIEFPVKFTMEGYQEFKEKTL